MTDSQRQITAPERIAATYQTMQDKFEDGRFWHGVDLLLDLVDAIKFCPDDQTEEIWYIGEGSIFGFTLADFIEGAWYWFADHHRGQYHVTYAALSALGTIFSPGMGSEPEASAQDAYDWLSSCEDLI